MTPFSIEDFPEHELKGEGDTFYEEAPEVAEIAKEIIEKHHSHLNKDEVIIKYYFRSNTPKTKGVFILGAAKKITGLNAAFAEQYAPFFCIVISEPVWKELSLEQKKALVDHELCHCGVRKNKDDETVLEIIEHDVQEFNCIVRRHGIWKDDLQKFAEAVKESDTPLLKE